MSDTGFPQLICEVCNNEPARGVAAIPGIPASVAYGPKCLAANAHPMWAIIANTAMIGGYDHAAEWWQQVVDDTLRHLDVDRDHFDSAVTVAMARMEADEREYFERERAADQDLPSQLVSPTDT